MDRRTDGRLKKAVVIEQLPCNCNGSVFPSHLINLGTKGRPKQGSSPLELQARVGEEVGFDGGARESSVAALGQKGRYVPVADQAEEMLHH